MRSMKKELVVSCNNGTGSSCANERYGRSYFECYLTLIQVLLVYAWVYPHSTETSPTEKKRLDALDVWFFGCDSDSDSVFDFARCLTPTSTRADCLRWPTNPDPLLCDVYEDVRHQFIRSQLEWDAVARGRTRVNRKQMLRLCQLSRDQKQRRPQRRK